ncbi:hypothetical protein [Streptococcus sp. S784/96/1]|uniref:hypothetical protein n=1 Tax=Streptococcus sp. S784/96/1 TaxID=2653499 RepID=UPI001386AEB9|nr:hypothetical protein [Streptococcus sp. S784/96/1]
MIFVLICLFLYIVSRLVNGFRLIDGAVIVGFLYFLLREWMQYEWNFRNLTDWIPIVFLIIYAISDILWGIRVIGLSIPIIQQIVLKYIETKDNLRKWYQDHLYEISEIVLVLAIFIGFGIQNFLKLPYVELSNQSLIEIFGFEFAIFSLYGIYAAFLQFLTENDKSYYLGMSKTRFMLDNSIWPRFTRAALFHVILLMIVIIPIIVKIEYFDSIRGLPYLWQTCYIVITMIYLNLLKLNLNIAYRIFRLNAEKIKKENNKEENNRRITAIYGLEKQISIDVQRFFTDEFWKVYDHQENYVSDYISIRLSEKLRLINDSEVDELVSTIFERELFENYNLANRIFEYIEKNKKKDFVKFFKFYKKFCKYKWNTLKNYQKSISSSTWKSLIEQDIQIFQKLIESDKTLDTLKIEYPDKEKVQIIGLYRDEKIREFLFSLLIDKEEVNLDEILGDIKKEIQNFKKNETKLFDRYTYDFLKFRLVTILDKYKNENIDLSLPKFQRLSGYNIFQNGQRNDYENNMLYSKICFNYLDRGRIEDFSQSKIEKSDNDDQRRYKIKAQKIKDLILSLNEEYRLAFMLYQLLYPDQIQWDDNLEFYDTEIKKIMNYGEQYHDYLFDQVKKIIASETNINDCITESFLDKLWETRNETIHNWSWFDQFGSQREQSDLKILYLQWLLAGKEHFHLESRFDIERDFPIKVRKSLIEKIKGNRKISVKGLNLKWRIRRKEERIGYFCRDYLILADKLDSIFEKGRSNGKQNNVQVSVEHLLHSGKVNLSDVIDDISVSGLLRLEWILRRKYNHYNQESNYTNRTFFDARTFWLGGDGVLEFYIVRIIDSFYYDLCQDREFMDSFKYYLESRLNSCNKTVEEYVESIAKKVSGIDNISILQEKQIISKLNDILFYQGKQIEANHR